MVAAQRSGRGRVPPHPDVRTISPQQVLEALVDPVRRRIARELYATEQDLGRDTIDLPASTSFPGLLEALVTKE
ncbi:hypothetical protein [Streptomyces vilmorinianum]|uniref:hypothetical protein n=1 Tax=Streptomyces vilmorinianum TaxID=3051092 RepID=UPI0010FB17B1|nr:hypothetical protein [Streptomyces vilmorinianum]